MGVDKGEKGKLTEIFFFFLSFKKVGKDSILQFHTSTRERSGSLPLHLQHMSASFYISIFLPLYSQTLRP